MLFGCLGFTVVCFFNVGMSLIVVKSPHVCYF